jgi:general secretion pathway protein B
LSFILEALRKSEHERQRRTGAELAHVRMARATTTIPRWVYLLGALLAVNLIALLALGLFRGGADDHTGEALARDRSAPEASRQITQPVVLAASGPDSKIQVERPQEGRELRSLRTEAAGRTRPDEVPATQSAEPAPASAPGASRPARTITAGGSGEAQTGSGVPREPAAPEEIPQLDALRARGLVDLPDLNMDIHVYEERGDGRFIFINTQKYREGDQLKEGPSVEEITREGVILQYRNQRFLLPRT